MTEKEKQNIQADVTANFEIEGITVTQRMLDDGMKILNGDITIENLIEGYTKEFTVQDDTEWTSEYLLADFLHTFFNNKSETIGNFYARFLDSKSFTLVDENDTKCVDPSIYHLLEPFQSDYGFKICNDFVARLIPEGQETISMKSLFEHYEGDYKPKLVDFGEPVGREKFKIDC